MRGFVEQAQRLAVEHVLVLPEDAVPGLFGVLPGGLWRYGLTVNL